MSNTDKRHAQARRAAESAAKLKATRNIALEAAIARARGENDARAEWIVTRGHAPRAFEGGCPATIDDRVTLNARNRTPGLTFGVRSTRGTTIRAGKKNSLRLVRPNPAQGEEPMASPRFASHEVVERDRDGDYGEVRDALSPPAALPVAAQAIRRSHMQDPIFRAARRDD